MKKIKKSIGWPQKLIYSSKYDSIRKSPTERATAEMGLHEHLLCGYTPVFSLTNAIDTPFLVETLMAEVYNRRQPMLDMFENGFMRISKFRDFSSVNDFLADRLKKNTNMVSGNPNFIFSSIPFLIPSSHGYSSEQLAVIFSAMQAASVAGRPQNIRKCAHLSHSDHHDEKLETYLRAIELVSHKTSDKLLTQKPVDPSKQKTKDFPSIFAVRAATAIARGSVDEDGAVLLDKLSRANYGGRSPLHTDLADIAKLGPDDDLAFLGIEEKFGKNIVIAYELSNLVYNETIAYSISDETCRNLSLREAASSLQKIYSPNDYTIEECSTIIGTRPEIKNAWLNEQVSQYRKSLRWQDTFEMCTAIRTKSEKELKKNPDADPEAVWRNSALEHYKWLPMGCATEIVTGAVSDLALNSMFVHFSSIGSALLSSNVFGNFDFSNIVTFGKAICKAKNVLGTIDDIITPIQEINRIAGTVRKRKTLRHVFKTTDITSKDE